MLSMVYVIFFKIFKAIYTCRFVFYVIFNVLLNKSHLFGMKLGLYDLQCDGHTIHVSKGQCFA